MDRYVEYVTIMGVNHLLYIILIVSGFRVIYFKDKIKDHRERATNSILMLAFFSSSAFLYLLIFYLWQEKQGIYKYNTFSHVQVIWLAIRRIFSKQKSTRKNLLLNFFLVDFSDSDQSAVLYLDSSFPIQSPRQSPKPERIKAKTISINDNTLNCSTEGKMITVDAITIPKMK